MRKNMFYYVKRFGSFTLSQLPFNEVDALILSELSYMDFCGLVHTIREDMEPVDFLSLNSENLLKQMMGENEIGKLENHIVTWKSIAQERLDSKTLKAEHPALYRKYTNRTSYRRFSVRKSA